MDIDDVLVSVGMGRYQMLGVLLFGLMTLYSNVSPVTYIFTAGDLKYRCAVPECDAADPAIRTYEPQWLRFTTPYRQETGQPAKCRRFAKTFGHDADRCAPDDFDRNTEVRCHSGWVFEDHENTVGTEFGLMCEENKWKLSLVGSVNNFGQFVGIPLAGIIADKFGRKSTMIFGAVGSAALCLVQSLSVNFSMFLTLELLSSLVSSGVYMITFVLAMELVLPKYRVIYFALMECFYPLGAMLVGVIASQVKDWRLLLQLTNFPALLFISFFWLTEESMIWLETKGKHDKVVDTLKKIAKINKKPFPDLCPYITQTEGTTNNSKTHEDVLSKIGILKAVLRSSTIFWRVIRCSLIWIAITLVYYGLSITATDIAGDKYLNFVLVTAVEIPSCLLNWLVMEKMSRKMSLSTMFALNGITCVLYNLTPNEYSLLRLCLFLVSKLTITIAFCVVYMLTAEVFPTQMRATLLALCSMMGRIGSMLAPQTTLLAVYFGEYMTMMLFAGTAFVAAVITMSLPESKNVKLPNTLDQAEQIGTTRPKTDENSSS